MNGLQIERKVADCFYLAIPLYHSEQELEELIRNCIRLTLIIFPKLVDSYAVTFEVPKWFQDVTFTLFEYIGTQSDSTEDLVNQIINVDFPRIESKIDALPR